MNKLTLKEAYGLTLIKIEELISEGFKVSKVESNSRNNPETIAKYNSPDNLSPELWYHISFNLSGSLSIERIMDASRYLRMCGIRFDTGAGCGSCDWELDWSFSVKKGEDIEGIYSLNELEDSYNNLFKKEK